MLFDKDGNIHTKSKEIDTNLASAEFSTPPVQHPFSDSNISVSETDIIEAIDENKPNASPGLDEIPTVLLSNCKHAVAKPIYLIWSMSLKSDNVPSCYKSSIVTPLEKKIVVHCAIPSIYRPVSLTSHVIKIFERVIRKQLVTFLESSNLLCSHQHGFRSGHSCLTQLLHHFDDVLENYLVGADTDFIYLDYAKAFDKVDHTLLIKKLQRYGILLTPSSICF